MIVGIEELVCEVKHVLAVGVGCFNLRSDSIEIDVTAHDGL